MKKNNYTEEEIDAAVLGLNSGKIEKHKVITEAGDISKYLSVAIDNMTMTKVDLDKPETVKDRIVWYLNLCIDKDVKPTVTGLCNALGYSRKTLWAIRNGTRRGSQTELIEVIDSAYRVLEEMWENYMLNGKINPVSGIFLGKNYFGYADKQEVVLTPNNPLDNIENPDELKQKYLECVINDGEE